MKSRENILIAAGLVVILSCFGSAETVSAQGYAPGGPPPGYYYQPPSMTPTGPSMYPGVFYISGGAKVRDLKTLSIGTKDSQLTNIIIPGAPAFGQQNVNGPILYPPAPTGTSGTAPDSSGIWAYDDGFIEPTGGAGATPALYPSGASSGLGHFASGEDVGSFRIFDFHVQANDAGAFTIQSTTALSWSKLLTGLAPTSTNLLNLIPGLGSEPAPGTPYYTEQLSAGFAASTDAGVATDFQARIWGPYIEFGFQSNALFDVFYALSVFQVSKTFSETRQTLVPFARRGYRDTYAFSSSDTAAWTFVNFDSTGGATDQTYFIYPNEGSGKAIPTRTFFTGVDVTVPATQAQETISGTLDLTTWESKSGGRAWIPLWGLGRMGTSFGGLLAYTPGTLTANATYVATQAQTTANGFPIDVNVGDSLVTYSSKTDAANWNLGLFCAADLELGFSRLFVKSAIEYDYYFYGSSVESDVLSATYNLSGASATVLGGLRF